MNRKIHCLWCESVNSFKFQTCDYTSPSRHGLKAFAPKIVSLDVQGLIAIVACAFKGHYRLGHNELQGYLILFDPHAQTHDRQIHSDCPLSRLVVPCGSSHITASHKVQAIMPGLVFITMTQVSSAETLELREVPRLEAFGIDPTSRNSVLGRPNP